MLFVSCWRENPKIMVVVGLLLCPQARHKKDDIYWVNNQKKLEWRAETTKEPKKKKSLNFQQTGWSMPRGTTDWLKPRKSNVVVAVGVYYPWNVPKEKIL